MVQPISQDAKEKIPRDCARHTNSANSPGLGSRELEPVTHPSEKEGLGGDGAPAVGPAEGTDGHGLP